MNDLDSMRLELEAERSNHRRDNEYLVGVVRKLRAALTRACNELEDALQYKSGNLVKKHGDKVELARLRAVLARYPEEPGQGGTTP